MMSLIPDGWDVDGPDHSVGIFGYLAYHCDTEAQVLDDKDPEVFTCPVCGAVLDLTPPDVDELPDPPEYDCRTPSI